jgi:hypothetical protein
MLGTASLQSKQHLPSMNLFGRLQYVAIAFAKLLTSLRSPCPQPHKRMVVSLATCGVLDVSCKTVSAGQLVSFLFAFLGLAFLFLLALVVLAFAVFGCHSGLF